MHFLAILDDYSRESLAFEVDSSITGIRPGKPFENRA